MFATLANFANRLLAMPPLYAALWLLLLVATGVLAVMARTEWGRRRPMWRYGALAVVAHLALICLATTVQMLSADRGERGSAPVRVRFVVKATPSQPEPSPVEEATTQTPVVEAVVAAEEPPTPKDEPPSEPVAPQPSEPSDQPPVESTPPKELPAEVTPTEPPSEPAKTMADTSPPELMPLPQPAPVANPTPPQQSNAAWPDTTSFPPPIPYEPLAPTPAEEHPVAEQSIAPSTLPVSITEPPTPYASREIDDRLKMVEDEGGSRATEDAVAAGLAWLASAQSRDGRWDSDQWSGGHETWEMGHNRQGAGGRADTGVTGLALLAFLGAGNGVSQGPYAENVRAGVEFLLASQKADGNLAGNAASYAQTYCHSMATFALAEALATERERNSTSDSTSRLSRGVRMAIGRLVATQNKSGGGWRYRPGDRGDLSQMGWIVMACRSAELADVPPPPAVWTGIERFLRSTRRGPNGAFASYQPREAASRSMTAESLYCRQIVGWPVAGSPGLLDAVDYLLAAPPGQGKANLYYWYYATLALHHLNHTDPAAADAWRRWNGAMKRSLVASQVAHGPLAGSWETNTVWGGYGGRVYTTAMATMCLEVYYRYNADEVTRDPWVAARQSPTYR
ncbi:MAG: hypothetical protein AAGJ46_09840 [Planctomycetota bacterium]